MKCKNCGFINVPEAAHCEMCNTMIRQSSDKASSGGTRALIQILLFVAGTIAIVGILWVVMHDILHAV